LIGSLTRIVEARASKGYASGGAVAAPATDIQFRKPGPKWTVGPQASYSGDRCDAQLDAFRGTIYAAVDKIARRIAQMPVHLLQHQIGATDTLPEQIELHSHPFLTLFSPYNGRKPHEDFNVWELDYVTSSSLDLTGEAFWLIERDNYGKPARITPLPANRTKVILSKDTGMVAGHLFVPKGLTEAQGIYIPRLDMESLRQPQNLIHPFMVHFKYPSPTGIDDTRGWSPVKAAAYAYDINLFEQIYKSNFLQQGSQLGGIMQSDVALSKEQIEEYLDQFESRHRGVRKAGLPIILPKMLKWTTTEPTPRDIQWVEAIGVTESQMLQIYGISDAKLGRADIGNRSTAEAMDVTFNREVIQSRLDVKCAKINSDFLPIYPGQTDNIYFCVRYDDPVPADNETTLKQEDQDLKNGVITRNEIRKKRKMQPMGKWGDIAVVQSNNALVDTTAATVEDQMQPGALHQFEAEQQQKQADAAAKKEKTDAAKVAGKPAVKKELSVEVQEN
jgi:HK97 family phage portal protein